MTALQFLDWTRRDQTGLNLDIRDLQIGQQGGALILTAMTGPAGGLVRYRLEDAAAPVALDAVWFPEAVRPGLTGRLATLDQGGQAVTVVGVSASGGLLGYEEAAGGAIGNLVEIAAPAGLAGVSAAGGLAALYTSGAGYAYMAGVGGQTIAAYARDGSGGLQLVQTVADTAASHAADLAGMGGAMLGNQEYLLTASRGEAGVSSYRVDPVTGGLSLRDTMGAEKGLGILSVITAMEVVAAQGETFVVVASAAGEGSSGGALSVMRLGAGGALVPTDHVLDTRETRFGQVQSLSVVEVGGRIYLVAGGGDDGLSLFTLLPGGRLVHLDSVADSAAMGLANVSAVAMAAQGEGLQIVAAAQGEAGLTRLAVSLAGQGQVLRAGAGDAGLSGGAGDDVVMGGAGADTLAGGAGNDILADGAGADTLRGGAGADLFVLEWDGARDLIADFEPLRDRLDLSGWWMLYDPAALEIVTTATGARIVWRGEVLELQRAGGGGIGRGEVLAAIVRGPDRPPLLVRQDHDGTGGNDRLEGHAGIDHMQGFAGNDTLLGGDGDDWLRGGAGNDRIHAGPGNDRVAGGDGRDHVRLGMGADLYEDNAQGGPGGADTILADAGDDTVLGGGGDDVIAGHAGHDSLSGGAGDDRIFGGKAFDTLRGGDGNDTVVGGDGRDLAFLGVGDDVFFDNAQAGGIGSDTVWAGAGNDTVQGGGGGERLFGQGGADLLVGRKGDDRLFGGDQDDTLVAGAGADTVVGGNGRDRAFLGDGNDVFFDNGQSRFGHDLVQGGAGRDTIHAGGGNDTLTGGAGADVFVFHGGGIDHDTITDFTVGRDVLRLDDALWDGGLDPAAVVAQFARVTAAGVVFDFAGGDVITLEGLSSLAGLAAGLEIF